MCDFLGALIYQQNDEMGFGMIIRDRFSDLFDERCLSCFWRSDNQTALALANWSNEVEDSHRHVRIAGRQFEPLGGIDAGELGELRHPRVLIAFYPIDEFDVRKLIRLGAPASTTALSAVAGSARSP